MARRITPVAVDQPVAAQGKFATSGLGAAEGPLDVGPAPDQGDVRSVHPKLGAGRRVYVDIQASGELKFKQVQMPLGPCTALPGWFWGYKPGVVHTRTLCVEA